MKLLFVEEKMLRELILPDLKVGRKDFDLDHTKAVVYWMKCLLKGSSLNAKILITAAYAHDWGYVDMFPQGTTLKRIHNKKIKHMKLGCEKIGKLLREQLKDSYSKKQVKRIEHLVFVHDRLSQLDEEDEIMLMEADTLGMLDTEFVKPTFSKTDNKRFINLQVLKLRRPLFRHKLAINMFEKLLQRRISYYQKLS